MELVEKYPTLSLVGQRDEKIAAMIAPFEGQDLDAHYLAFFDCFNRQLFYEAHEVLEVLWLGRRQSPEAAFYQGLIQLAGAFLHVRKSRPGPAAALFKLARANLGRYPGNYDALHVDGVLVVIQQWLTALEGDGVANHDMPKLRLDSLFKRNEPHAKDTKGLAE